MPLTRARLRISDYNLQRKRKLKGKEHKVRMVSLSLTSMVDMFAILVIFLLTNNGSVQQWMELDKQIELPKARASDPPPKGPTIQISREQVIGDKKVLTSVTHAKSGSLIVDAVQSWLKTQTKAARNDGYVNIVADEHVPYGAIRRVIATCQNSGFKNVNLAVQPAAAQKK